MNRKIHKSKEGLRACVVAGFLLLLSSADRGQTVTATVQVGENPVAIAVNQVTNKI